MTPEQRNKQRLYCRRWNAKNKGYFTQYRRKHLNRYREHARQYRARLRRDQVMLPLSVVLKELEITEVQFLWQQ